MPVTGSKVRHGENATLRTVTSEAKGVPVVTSPVGASLPAMDIPYFAPVLGLARRR